VLEQIPLYKYFFKKSTILKIHNCLLKIISQNSIPLSLLYKVNCDILEIKILYKLGENLSKNEFARAFTSNNSQN
jgi:hypothetical protein